MFADDNSIENIQQLFLEFKKYLELQKKYTQLEVAEKLTILLSTQCLIELKFRLLRFRPVLLISVHALIVKEQSCRVCRIGWTVGQTCLVCPET